jgi:hypothetical protein
VFAIDIEACRRCGGKLRVIASIEEPPVIEQILEHLACPKAEGLGWLSLAGLLDRPSSEGFQIAPAVLALTYWAPIRIIPRIHFYSSANSCQPDSRPIHLHAPFVYSGTGTL